MLIFDQVKLITIKDLPHHLFFLTRLENKMNMKNCQANHRLELGMSVDIWMNGIHENEEIMIRPTENFIKAPKLLR